MKMLNDYVTHNEFQLGMNDLKKDIIRMEDRLSEKLSNRINETYWKFLSIMIPIFMSFAGLTSGAIYLVVKSAMRH